MKLPQKVWKFIHDVNYTAMSDPDRTAVEDGARKYTYGMMFREWERYAAVFSALGISAGNHARAGLLGSTCAEVIFSFYGLNMAGADVSLLPAYSVLTPEKLWNTIRDEHLTDFIVTDDFAQPGLIADLFRRRKELGLRNVIILHVPVAGVTVHPALRAAQEAKYLQLKLMYRSACMEHLLAAHAGGPVKDTVQESCDTACILHTSGTTGGAGKPVPLSDAALNAAAACFYDMEDLKLPWEHLVTAAIVDLSNAYGIIDQVHVSFAMGATVVCVPGNALNPWLYKAIPEHKISFLFTISAMFEHWMKMPGHGEMDFSSLRFVVLGGTSVSAADKRRYLEFLQKHGAGEITMLNGYGVSELGGACCLSSADIGDEAIGFPLPGVQVRICDEAENRYRSPADAPCEGVLYLTSPSLATLELDGKTVIRTETIGDEPYVCTNDLVSMDEAGKLTFLGRASRYFLNEEGRKFESARVEAEFSRQNGIGRCAVAPVYVKTTHDNIPMLCVQISAPAEEARALVLDALRRIYIVEKTLGADQLPCRIMIVKELPRNGNGKVDLYRLGRGEAEGDMFTLEPVRMLDRLADFRLRPCQEGPADMIQEVFDGISPDFRESLPFHKTSSTDKNEEETKMENSRNVLGAFNAMNRMGRAMMKNMMNMNPGKPGASPFCDMSGMMKKMADMNRMNQKAADMMHNARNQMGTQAGNMLPQMQAQMNQIVSCMNMMNQTALSMMQMVYAQNLQMMNQFFEMAGKQAAAAQNQTGEAGAEESAAQPDSGETEHGEDK